MVLALGLLLIANGIAFGQTANYQTLRLEGLKEYRAGHFAEAQRLLENALNLSRQSNDAYAVALVHESLGDVYHNQFDFTKAEQEYMQAASILRGQPEHSHALAITLVNLAGVFSGQRRFSEALTLLAEVSKLAKKNRLNDPRLDLEILNARGIIYFNQGQSKKAEGVFARAMKVRLLPGIDMALDFANVLNNVATIYAERQDYRRAAESYARALQLTEEGLGSSHPNLSILLDNLGFMYIRMGQYTEAERQFLRSLAILETNGFMPNDAALRTLHGLGRTYIEMSDANRAETVLSQAVQIGRTGGLSNSEMVEILELYAGLIARLSRASEAEQLHTEAARMRSELAFTVHAKSR